MASLYRSLLVPTRIMLKASHIVMQLILYGAGCIAALFYSMWAFRMKLTKGPSRVFQKIKRLPPKILTDSCYGEHNYLTLKKSGTRLHYVTAGEEGACLMLFFACISPEFSWRHQLKVFSQEFKVVALDMKGCDLSDAPLAWECYQRDIILEDIQDVIKALGSEDPKCILVGHNWGAAIACEFAANHPNMVEKLIFMMVFQHMFSSVRLIFFCVFGLTIRDSLFRVQWSLKLYVSGVGIWLDYFTRKDILVPTLLLWGKKDAYMEDGLVNQILPYLQGSYHIHFFPDVSHWLPEEQPEKVNQVIRDFLQGKKNDCLGQQALVQG
uniref:AB hydrolase-1 domain-containing protein n=1 Tax=Laticauda laticaudata TaxID=8630 RepID=A0A8C5WTH1_LATLA